jgi:cobyrinic acid a,c-diamide synthase
MDTACFKKGPDYIDSAWLSFASGKQARNLDTYLMDFPAVKKSFLKNAVNKDISIIEGNRGLFDGFDSQGTHSTAELAKLLQSPVIIVQNISKVTRTAAASILGCKNIDPDLNVAGVILNQVAGERHGKVAKEAIEDITGIPVVGSIPKLHGKFILPSRHLGLITPEEYEQKYSILNDLRIIVEDYVDISKLLEIASNVPVLENIDFEEKKHISTITDKVKIGYFKDQSFSFYYPENLEMLDTAGAELVPVSPTVYQAIEDLDALYIGGGFPETNLTSLSINQEMIDTLRRLVEDGLPVYAECGGLMYLAKDVEWNGKKHSLSGILPISIQMNNKPQGHGYCEAIVDKKNPFYKICTIIKGHEFHYSNITNYYDADINSSLSMKRGVGCFNKRDGIIYKNVFASYLHIHALATPEWVEGMIKCAKDYREFKNTKILIEG